MKKIWLLALILLPIKVYSYSAASLVGYDLDAGRVLYGYNIDDKRLIASTTKIMTAIVAIENSDIEKVVEVSDIIYKAYGSAIYIEVGEKITLKDLLYGLLLRSGNDAALIIAEKVAGSVEEFVYLMNEYADNLRMTNTIFYNPHGLEEQNGNGNESTALDMAKLTRYAMQNETFRKMVGTKDYIVKTNYKTYSWHNKNKLLKLDYITGGKTGYTELARRTLVTTGSKNNMNIVVVTLNDPNDWQDHQSVYEGIFKKYHSYEIINKNKIKINDTYYKNKLYIKNNYYMTLTKEELKKITLNISIIKLEDYVDDELVGEIEVILDKKIYHKEPIYIKKEVKKEKSWWRVVREKLFKW